MWLSAGVCAGDLILVDRSQEVEVDASRAEAGVRDLAVDVLRLVAELEPGLEAERLDPELVQEATVEATDRNLLHSEHTKRPLRHGSR